MQLPDPVEISQETAVRVAAKHGLRIETAEQIASDGIINSVFSLDDRFVLRVPRNHEAHIEQARVEASAIPPAVEAGVRTPCLIAFDDTCDVLPVPFLILEYVAGRPVEPAAADPYALTELWMEVGRDLGRLHSLVDADTWPRNTVPRKDVASDCQSLLDDRVREGWISHLEANWLGRWVDELALNVKHSWARCATHGDVQMSNVMMRDDGSYAALLDWGCAAAKDPVVDFMPLPLGLVPPILAGHREIAPLPNDDTAESRILLVRLRTWLKVVPRGAAPGMTWGERPGAWITDLLAFFTDPPTDSWRELRPPLTPR